MTSTFLLLHSPAKAATNIAALRTLPFFNAAFHPDTVNPIGDSLDNGRSNWRNQPGYRPRAPLSEVLLNP